MCVQTPAVGDKRVIKAESLLMIIMDNQFRASLKGDRGREGVKERARQKESERG